MSELKATTAQEIVRNEKDCDYMDELFGGVKMPPTQVYLKSEADAFIADLEESHKKEVEQLLIEIVKLNEGAQNLILDDYLKAKKVRHSKYKRCLAMARWCKDNADWWNYEQINRLHEQRGNAESFRFKEAHNRFCFFAKWNERWLELAEKFKEEKKILELVEKSNTLYKENN